MSVRGEVLDTVKDWQQTGDAKGHAVALWRVLSGRVKAGDRYTLSDDVEPVGFCESEDDVQGRLVAILGKVSPLGLRAMRGLLTFYALYDVLPRDELAAIRDAVHVALQWRSRDRG